MRVKVLMKIKVNRYLNTHIVIMKVEYIIKIKEKH